jgi:hypothetical protein
MLDKGTASPVVPASQPAPWKREEVPHSEYDVEYLGILQPTFKMIFTKCDGKNAQ